MLNACAVADVQMASRAVPRSGGKALHFKALAAQDPLFEIARHLKSEH